MNLPITTKLLALALNTSMLALGETFHHPQTMAEESGAQAETTASSMPIEFSKCGSGERDERWQRSSEY